MNYATRVTMLSLMLFARVASACPNGYQEWHTERNQVCLPQRMIDYLTCIEGSGGGKITVEQDSSADNSKGIIIKASGEGGNLIAKGKGKISVDASNVDKSMRRIKEQFDPKTTTNCYFIANGGRDRGSATTSANSATDGKRQIKSTSTGNPTPSNASASGGTKVFIRPNSPRTTNWDGYCKNDGFSNCEFLIYAGRPGYTEKYQIDAEPGTLKSAIMIFSAALDDAPADPSYVNYTLRLTINGRAIPELYTVKNLAHGKPLGGPLTNFSDERIQLPVEYFQNGDNEITFELVNQRGSWVVFRRSELRVTMK